MYIWMDIIHIAHHSASASNACQQGKEKWSQKHPEVVNSNLLGQIRFFTQKSCDRLWSTMLWWKPQGILSPAATPHLLVRWRPGRGRQYQGFVMQWIPTAARKQPVTCSDNDKTYLSFEMTGSLGPFENLHRSAPPSKHPNPSSYQFSTSRTTAWDDSDMKPVDSTKIK